jgi:hypothetical protein
VDEETRVLIRDIATFGVFINVIFIWLAYSRLVTSVAVASLVVDFWFIWVCRGKRR